MVFLWGTRREAFKVWGLNDWEDQLLSNWDRKTMSRAGLCGSGEDQKLSFRHGKSLQGEIYRRQLAMKNLEFPGHV